MNNTYNYLLTKTQSIEETVESLKDITDDVNNKSSISVSKNFLNLSTTSKRNVFICELEPQKNTLMFQLNAQIKISAAQTIELSLKSNEKLICKTTQTLEPGRYNLQLFKDNFYTYDKLLNISIGLCSIDKKHIYLESANLVVDGVKKDNTNHNYSVVEAGEKLLLSYSQNGDIYFNFVDKLENQFNQYYFKFLTNAKSHQIVYNSQSNKLYMFRIDTNNNLFWGELFTNNEFFIDNNVTLISATFTKQSLAFCYLKNKKCFIGEIENNTLSTIKQVSQIKKILIGCYLYFNNYKNKLFLILTDSQNNNYILESQTEKSNSTENLFATFSINVEAYEVSDET